MNGASNRHSRGSSLNQLVRDSKIGKESERDLSIIKEGSNGKNAQNVVRESDYYTNSNHKD